MRPSKERKARYATWLLACASLIARLVLVARGRGVLSFWDEHDYDAIARALLAGRGFSGAYGPTAFRPPGQPFFLAAVYAIAGARPIVAEVVQALLLTTVPFAAARLARLISRRRGVSLLAAAIAALHPALAYSAATLFPVALTTVALSWGVVFLSEAIVLSSVKRAAIGGAFAAIATLATPYFVFVPVIAAAVALVRSLKRRSMRARLFSLAIVAGVVGVAPITAWTARNAVILGIASPTTTAGYNLALGANDDATPRSGNWVEAPDVGVDGEVARDRAYKAAANAWIQAHPVKWSVLTIERAIFVLDSVGKPRTRGAHDGMLALLVGWALLPITLFGVVELVRRRKSVAALVGGGALVCVIVASAPTIVKPRFRFPCDVALAPFAASAFLTLLDRARRVRAIASARKVEACPS